MKKTEITSNGRHSKKDVTTAINFDSDWRYIRITNTSSYDKEFTSFSYDDREWESIQLPHNVDKKVQKFTSTCISYWYRKRFDLRPQYDKHQHIYLHFESITKDNKTDNEDADMKIPAVTIWLNENQLFSNTLPEPVDLTQYLKNDSENLLVIHSKHGYRLRLHARLLLPRRLSRQIDLDELPENSSQGRGSTLDYTASFDDSDGLIDLFIGAFNKKFKKNETYNTKQDADKDSDIGKEPLRKMNYDESVEVKTILNGSVPRLAIVMLIVGTRGDVQPFVALSKTLLACGHRVRLATHEIFRKFVRENGIEYYPLAGDPADLMSFMVKNAGIVPSVSSIVAGDVTKSRRLMAEILGSTWKACIEDDDETGIPFVAEVIIANPPSYGHIHCAQKLQIPLHIVFTMPWSPTIQFPHPLCKVDYNRAPIEKINMLSYGLVEVLTWSGMRDIINEFRKGLGLSALHTRQAVGIMMDEHVPHTYCWSPSLVPKPNDWPAYIGVSGFFFLDLATNYIPPDDIVQFLKAGEPPIYIGFGSITGHDSERLLEAVLQALKTTGYRALLSGFDVDNVKLPDNVLKIGNCPHDWLFQHVVAVCHHGGAGTTAAGLRLGKPTIIVPFFGDQFFWGSMISKSGAGPLPMPGKTVTAKQLAEAFEFVHEPKTQEAALKISINFQSEKGCDAAVRSFHAHLPLSKMRSDLESSFGVCCRLSDYDLQLSRPVAQVLVAAGAIEESELSPHKVYGWSSLLQGDHFEAIARGFRRAASKITDSVHRLKRSKSMHALEPNTSRSTQNITRQEIMNIGRPFKDCLPLYGEIKERSAEEHDEEAERRIKHSVRYGLATLVTKPPIDNHRHSTGEAGSLPAVSSPGKMIVKPRTNNVLSRNSSNRNNQTATKVYQQTNTKNQRSLLPKGKSSVQSKDQINSKSPEQKAAEMSGFSIDVCKKILSEFQQLKEERFHANGKSAHRIKIGHGLHRQRSRSTAAH